ncbi:enoyl-CoA hydratase/isomerase family protein [Alkalibacillus aidingensis]|uniref:enoyl-CoA hydratase/isomerase family protein n=1 Tax=Alkalibacillus aidingensis TaxID=2747607 RepID=UPI0016606521|nr:enoyl-CoA hydratase-related protein [Alkalibacillus aidingensis]
MSDIVTSSIEGSVAYVCMNRDTKLNALSRDLVKQLLVTLDQVSADDQVKVVVLKGHGKAFCSGGDLETMSTIETAYESLEWIDSVAELTTKIRSLKPYVVAKVQGYAAGAGFSLAMACDFVIAKQDAKFAISFTNVGLIPDLGLIKSLTDRVSPPLVKEWVSSGKVLSAKEAFDYQLINRIAEGSLDEEVEEFIQFILNGPSAANRYVKDIVNVAGELTFEQCIEKENKIQAILLQTEDHQEGIQAFLEKRSPQFKGR